ncbi:MAG: hypothetical protein HC836_23200 [Richelia sp. RM2_1_2]|nr:hypothetical protein [Richelia sp. RM2_1_2]
MATEVWLEHIGIIHMSPKMTAAKMEETGYTSLSKPDMLELARIIEWLDKENTLTMLFWRWKKMNGTMIVDGKQSVYWRLLVRVLHFLSRSKTACPF